ncbi:MAG: pentapeptide repeat-containing protein, partial [Okeania sp. SIO2D1]|nr:pentapeptide repeat-containing protein [Okeania sp. SIO2D1]
FESGQRRVDIYTGLNVMILLFELHRYGQSQEGLREQLHFYPCGKPDSEDFEETRLLRIIGYSQCLGYIQCPGNNAFGEIVGSFLRDANLSCADLSHASLFLTNLCFADLRNTKLVLANLSCANLRDADLRYANLSHAILLSADLSGANLCFADLSGTNLSDAKWDNNTKWSHSFNLHEAVGVPEDLQQNPEFAAAVAQSKAIRNESERIFG